MQAAVIDIGEKAATNMGQLPAWGTMPIVGAPKVRGVMGRSEPRHRAGMPLLAEGLSPAVRAVHSFLGTYREATA